MRGKQASSKRRTHHCVGIQSCAAAAIKMPVVLSFCSHAHVSMEIQIDVYTVWEVRWRYSAVLQANRGCLCVLFYNYASVSQSSLSVSPSNFLTSELKYVSCCLLVPAGFHEKYPCVLTETQQSRRSGGVNFLILLFEQAECIFPKPQNHLACALALSVWGRRLVGTMVHL